MSLKNSTTSYGTVSKALHWSIALLILFLLGLGLYMDGMEASPEKYQLYGLHKSLGIITLALVAARIAWLFYNKPPKPEASLSKAEARIAQCGHGLLYLLMLAMPLSGWVMSSAGEHAVSVFGWFDMPAIVAPNKVLGGIAKAAHGLGGWALIALVALHVLSALKHHFVGKNSVLKRMSPFNR